MKLSGNKRDGRYVQMNNQYQEEMQSRRRYEEDDEDPRERSVRRSRQEPQSRNAQVSSQQRINEQRRAQASAGARNNGQNTRGGRTGAEDQRNARAAVQKKRQRRARRILASLLLIVIALATVLYCVYKFGVKAPEMKPPMPSHNAPSAAANNDDADANASPSTFSADRKGNQWTFVIVGFDDGNGNTDTIMVANFDADHHKLNVVNVPRDTLVNVSWYTKKANTLYSSGGGIDGIVKGLYDILGFQVDFHIVVDLKAFEELVDAVGGVDFDVPVNMNYDDPAQDLHIHFQKGQQHLNGKQAMEVVRFRKGYADADIGRISTQQDFLSTAAAQILAKQNKLNLEDIVSIFLKYVKTDLSAGNLVWLGKEFYKMDSQNITFTTLPGNYGDSVNNTSYVTITVTDWLKVLNEKISPFKQEVTAKDLSILTRDKNGKLYVTNGVWAGKKTWGGASASSASSTTSSSGKNSSSGSGTSKPSSSAKPSASASENTSPSASTTKPSPSSGTEQPSASPSADKPDTNSDGSSSPSVSTGGGDTQAPSEAPAAALSPDTTADTD